VQITRKDYSPLLVILLGGVRKDVIFEDGCVRKSFPALLAGIRTRVGVDPFMADPFAAIVEVAVAVHTLVWTVARMTTDVCSQFAHLSKRFIAYSESNNIFVG